MKRIHILGRKNSGKTTLMLELIAEFLKRGKKVGTIKHTSHHHPLDTPGKDSARHRETGGSPAAVISGNVAALFLTTRGEDDAYDELAPHYAHCDLVLVEGDLDARCLKIEVWRKEVSEQPYALSRNDILGIVTDDPVETTLPIHPRSDVSALADAITSLLFND